jgi:S-adenosylmethionine hydrolase
MTWAPREAVRMAKVPKHAKPRASIPGGNRRSAIALVTDFGVSGFYAGAMKGAILAADPDAVIVDLTHGIRPFAIAEASFVLSVVFEYWAPGTVFLAVVDPGVGGGRRNIIVRSNDRLVVCPDNGIASDVAERFGIDGARAIDETTVAQLRRHRPRGRTFLGRDVFAPVAAFLAAGGDEASLGIPIGDIRRLALPGIEVRDGYVRGESRYADDYGNLLTNISGDDIARAFGDTPLAGIRALVDRATAVGGIAEYFAEGASGDLKMILDSWNLLEIAVREGRAADRFPPGRPVVVELSRG